MRRLTFAFMAAHGRSEQQAVLLTRSIRTFAGLLSGSRVLVLLPEDDKGISQQALEALSTLDARCEHFRIERSVFQVPFAAKVFASAAAETVASGEDGLLVWMDTGSLVIREPKALLLRKGKALGCRPVDHTLIGSLVDQPPDRFWQSIYRECSVPEENVFAVTSTVDQKRIRAYFNAGLLVVRPERAILQGWRDSFCRLASRPDFEETCERDNLYSIFFHQAVLAGTILSRLDREEIQELPYLVNYPLHMHAEYPADRRPAYMNSVVSGRYEELFAEPAWARSLPVREPLKSWLAEQLSSKGVR